MPLRETSFMYSARTSLRHSLAFITLLLASVLLMTGCSLPWKHSTANVNTAAANAPKPTTQQLLTALQKNFRAVSSFHVVLLVQNPGAITQDQVQIRNANGDVVMP